MMKFTLLVTLISTIVWAQTGSFTDSGETVNSRPYFFSGPCTSHGSWTQEALNQTQRLREITTQLRDDPSCKALGDSLQRSFGEIQASLTNTQQSMGGAQTNIRDLGQELKALREFTMENPLLSKITGGQMVSRLFSLARLQTASNDQVNARPSSMTSEMRQQLLTSLGDRMQRVAGRGFTLFNNTIDSLPHLNECITQKNAMGQFFASSISMLGALVSSGQDPLGTQTAMAVSKIANFMRDKAFSEVIGKLNQQDFMASVQCIMETTSESYCAARDSQLLFNQMTAELKARKDTQDAEKAGPLPSGRKFDNPLNGFYVLTQLSPIVTDWIFRIQIGSSPKLRQDGEYQMSVLNNANTFYVKMKEIESEFNQLKRNIATFTDFESKQNYAKELVFNISDKILKAGGGTGENFFQNAGSEYEIYFNLLGLPIPRDVREKGAQFNPMVWLNINYKSLPIFSNPDNVPNIVWSVLTRVFEAGKANMLSYYFKNFVYDPIAVTDESLLGLPYNIKNALASIDNYLANLQQKIEKNSKDETMIGSITDTRIRIGKVFYRYNDLIKFVKENKHIMTTSPTPEQEREYKEKLLQKNVALMEEVYDKFEVMLAKSGFLANRLTSYVTYDFQLFVKDALAKNSTESEQLYKEIAYASGRIAYEQLVQMAGNNPTNVQYDLNRASRIFKENLAAQEMLFTDSLVGILQKLKLSATKPYLDSQLVSVDSVKRAYKDGWEQNPLHERNPVRRFLTGVWGMFKAVTGFEEQKYPVHLLPLIGIRDNLAYSTDDENRSTENVFNRICIQALSFNDYKNERWRALYNLCKDTHVNSPFNTDQLSKTDLQIKVDDYLAVNFQKKFREDLPDYRANHSKRICAFRDYNRRNLVVYLTMNFKTTDILENNYSKNPYMTLVKPDPAIKSVDPTQTPGNIAVTPTTSEQPAIPTDEIPLIPGEDSGSLPGPGGPDVEITPDSLVKKLFNSPDGKISLSASPPAVSQPSPPAPQSGSEPKKLRAADFIENWF